jgi:hypothetical protein
VFAKSNTRNLGDLRLAKSVRFSGVPRVAPAEQNEADELSILPRANPNVRLWRQYSRVVPVFNRVSRGFVRAPVHLELMA